MSGRPETVNVIPGHYALAVGPADMPAPPGWIWVRLQDVARLETGHTPSREHPEYWGGDIGWLGIKDARSGHGGIIHTTAQTVTPLGLENSAARLLPAKTVCLSRTASVGYVVIMGKPMATSQDFVNWICSEAIEPAFLLHLLIAENESLFRFGKGTTHTTIYFPEVKAFHVCIPPPAEQRRIVAKIEALQAHSRKVRQALEAIPPLLEQFRQSLLAAAFRGDLTADWREQHPDQEPASTLLERIRDERRRRWEEARPGKEYAEPEPVEDGDLPDLPEGWCWVSVEELLAEPLCNGISPRGSDAPPGEPALKLNAMGEDGFDYSAIRYIPIDGATAEELAVQEGDFFISRGNGSLSLVGRGTLAQTPPMRVVFPDTMIRLRFVDRLNMARWVAALWPSGWVRQQIERRVKTTAGIWKVSQPDVASVPLPLPPIEEQQRIAATLELANLTRQSVLREVQGLVGEAGLIDQSILAKAFRGELVPQDPDDEPASVLLEHIRAERAAVQAGGKANRSRNGPPS